MGLKVGASVGLLVGESVGNSVIVLVGSRVGLSVGCMYSKEDVSLWNQNKKG